MFFSGERKWKVCVVGLGYVGLPLACLSSKYYDVVGIDIDQNKVNNINQNISPIVDDEYTLQLFKRSQLRATINFEELKSANIIVICVPTPVDEKHHPDLNPLKSAVKAVSNNLQKGQLVIVESTIYPGTTEEVVVPLLEESGLQANLDFGVAYCPERIDPGNKMWVLENISRVLGGLTNEDAEKAKSFYEKFINAEIKVLESIKSAEAVKILENTFRDVNIAFINEMARSFDNLGINLHEVIKGASTKPFGFMPFYPGPGVGGHCIPVDPYYLIERAKLGGFDHRFLHLARKINSTMPSYVVEVLQNELNKLGKALSQTKIGIMGCSYKKNVGDVRESPALQVIELLKKKGSQLEIYDPHVKEISTTDNLQELLTKTEVLVLLTSHDHFKKMELNLLKEQGIQLIIDTRNCLNSKDVIKLGIAYKGIGQ